MADSTDPQPPIPDRDPKPDNVPRVELLPPGYRRPPVRRGDFEAARRRRR